MALKECRECENTVSDEAESCPHCGVPDPTTSPKTGWRIYLYNTLWLAILMALVWGGTRESCSQTNQEQKIPTPTFDDFETSHRTTQPKKQVSKPDLDIVSWNWRKDSDFAGTGQIIYNVEVRNNSPQYIKHVEVKLTTYDSRGNIVGSDSMYVSDIPRNGTSSNKGYATYSQQATDAKVQLGDIITGN